MHITTIFQKCLYTVTLHVGHADDPQVAVPVHETLQGAGALLQTKVATLTSGVVAGSMPSVPMPAIRRSVFFMQPATTAFMPEMPM